MLSKEKRSASRSAALSKAAKRFCKKLGELKGSYVKIGQMLAMFGEHLLPAELTSALHELEHQTIPLDWQFIESHVDQALGEYKHELDIEPQAFAAASLGQVHRATIKSSGEQICLKIQYPGIATSIDSDFNDVIGLLKLSRWLPKTQNIGAWIEDIKTLLHQEIDYQREAELTQNIRTRLQQDPRFYVPEVFERYSTKNIIALEYIEGFEITADPIQQLSLERRSVLGQSMLDLFLTELFDWNMMQTDPNFGNYRVKINDNEPDQLILLDFGAVRKFQPLDLESLRTTIVAAHINDSQAIIEGLKAMQFIADNHSDSVKQSFSEFCMILLEPVREITEGNKHNIPDYALNQQSQYRWRESKLIKRACKHVANSSLSTHFSFPAKEFFLVVRKLTGVFSFISVLGAEFSGYSILEKHIQDWKKITNRIDRPRAIH